MVNSALRQKTSIKSTIAGGDPGRIGAAEGRFQALIRELLSFEQTRRAALPPAGTAFAPPAAYG